MASQDNSQVINVSVQDENPAIAVEIANTTAEVFQQEISDLMNVDNLNILSPTVLSENTSPIKPNKMLNIAIGAIIGVGLAFLLEYMDTIIKSEQDVENLRSSNYWNYESDTRFRASDNFESFTQ